MTIEEMKKYDGKKVIFKKGKINYLGKLYVKGGSLFMDYTHTGNGFNFNNRYNHGFSFTKIDFENFLGQKSDWSSWSVQIF